LFRSPQSVEFILMLLGNEGGAFGQFSLEPSPSVLIVLLVLGQKQPEGFLGAQLGHSGKIFHTEAVQNFSPFQMSFAQAQWAFDGFGR
jgi:hypothetical protein